MKVKFEGTCGKDNKQEKQRDPRKGRHNNMILLIFHLKKFYAIDETLH
jgi:hypothetical protein